MRPGQRRWIDISVPIHPGLVHWPGDPDVQMDWRLMLEKGDDCNLSILTLSSHTGTHLDAPLHFLPGGATLDSMPLEALIGPARVVEIKSSRSAATRSAAVPSRSTPETQTLPHGECILPEHLRGYHLRRGERILLKTRNSKLWNRGTFEENFVYLSQEAAEYLAERGVQTVGIDYLSVGGFKYDSVETHQVLLTAGIWIIEGLDLSRVAPGRYDLICLPLKVLGSEGAPARAVLRRR